MLYPHANRFVVALVTAFVAFTCVGSPFDNWHWRNPLPQGNSLLDVTANPQGYVAVGDHGTIIVSPDGETWAEQSSGTLATLRGVTFGAGRFVAVGDLGTILTSTNGTNWQLATGATLSTLRGVTYADNSFLAVGDDGLILSSTDSATWSTVHTGPYGLEDIAFGNGMAIAVGGTVPTNFWNDGNAVVLVSTNRVDWTARESGFPSRVYSVSFGMGHFVATTGDLNLPAQGVPSVGTSSNSVDWTHYLSAFSLSDAASGNDKFVAIGAGAWCVHSYDGRTWETNNQSFSEMRPQAITHGPNGFVAVGAYGAMIRSPDGIEWYRTSFLSAYQIEDIDYGNGFFLALTGWVDGGSNVWTSADGTMWRAHAGPGVDHVTFGNGVFVGSTPDGQILTTSNGVDWVIYQTGHTYLRSEIFCDGIFIVGLGSDHEFTSANGIDWTLAPVSPIACQSPDPGNFTSVAFGKGLWVATTWNGEIWSSLNRQEWILRQEGSPIISNRFTFTYSRLSHITFAGGIFVAVGGHAEYGGVYGDIPRGGGIIDTSVDGIKWSRAPIRVSSVLKSAVYGNGTFVAIGSLSNTILQSDPFTSLSIRPGAVPRLLVEGPAGAPIKIEASEAPSGSWTNVHSATLGPVAYEWTDPGASQRRFYRALLQR